MQNKQGMAEESTDYKDKLASSYDEFEYQSNPFWVSHPENIAAISLFSGFRPVRPDKAKVLEIGCASGGNLIPMAVNNPDSLYVGVDISENQIKSAVTRKKALGLNNIYFLQKGIEEVEEEFGKFDYILCHGVFSWVPKHVQTQILNFCKTRLSDNGLAYISYNTYPLWHQKMSLLNAMRFMANGQTDPKAVRNSIESMLSLANDITEMSFCYKESLSATLNYIKDMPEYYLSHEFLDDFNQPFYFSEICELIKNYDLDYVVDANIDVHFIRFFNESLQNKTHKYAQDRLQREQVFDFIEGTGFRSSVFCKGVFAEKFNLLNAAPMYVSTRANHTLSGEVNEWQVGSRKVTCHDDDAHRALKLIASVGIKGINFEVLTKQVFKDSDAKKTVIYEQFFVNLAKNLLKTGLCIFRFSECLCVTEVSDKPMLSPLAILQLRNGETTLTSQGHTQVPVKSTFVRMLSLFDGSKSIDDILNLWDTLFDKAEVVSGKPIINYTQQEKKQLVSLALESMCKNGMLVG